MSMTKSGKESLTVRKEEKKDEKKDGRKAEMRNE